MFPVPDVRKLEQKKRGKEGELWRATPIHAGTMHKARAFRVRVRPVAAIQLSKLDLWLRLLEEVPFPLSNGPATHASNRFFSLSLSVAPLPPRNYHVSA